MQRARPGKVWSAARVAFALALCAFSSARSIDIINTATVSQVGRFGAITLPTNAVRAVKGTDIPATLRFYTNTEYEKVATVTSIGVPLFLGVSAPGFNLNPAVAEKCRITITSKLTGDSEVFDAVETGPNTGIFRVLGGVPTSSHAAIRGDGTIQTVPNDTLSATLNDDTKAVAATVLVDPLGTVFDSKTNQPIAGARVTLVDANSGTPALVFLSDGSTASPNPVVTGADGRYRFPAVAPGTYRLEIVPPPGYNAPSKISPGALPHGHTINPTGSYGGNFNVSLAAGAVTIDVPLDPVSSGTLFVQKTASRNTAEIGEFVDFTVRVKNVSTVTLRNLVIDDRLPFGFAFARQSAQLEGRRHADPRGTDGADLQFDVGALDPDKTITLTYRTRIGIDALHGDGINRAQASNRGTPGAKSNVATARVLVRGGVFTNRGIIFGKVFLDKNQNREQDAGEPAIPGARIYIEDGSYAITDSGGKFSFYGVKPGTHVAKLDRTTLPPHAKLEPLNTRNAGDGGSVFVELKSAEMHKANFAISNATDEIMEYVAKMRAAAEKAEAGDIGWNLKSDLNREGVQQIAADPRSLPSSGTITPGVAVQPTMQDRTQSAEAFVLGGPRVVIPTTSGAGGGSSFGFPSSLQGSGVARDARLPGANPVNSAIAATPAVPLEQAISADTGAEKFGFIDLKDRDTLPAAQTTVRVKSVLGGKVAVRVNGREVPDTRIGKRVTLADQGSEATEFIGIALQPGENKLELEQRDQFGNARGSKTITVIAPDKLGRIKITVPDNATADGKTPARIAVELVDAHGVPVTARTALTLEASMGKWLVPDINPREPGVQVFIEGGHAEYQLAPPVEPGDSRVRVSSGVLEGNVVVSFLPELRPLLGVGVVEGAINISHLSANSLRPVSSRDTFDTELREFAVRGNNVSAAGRVAFFLKGKIRGNYLLTAAYDSEKDTRDRLFKAPVPSLDADLNPVSIRATYEVEQAGDRSWVYGADAQVKITDRLQVGGAFARDENPLDQYGLYSGNAAFNIGQKTLLFGEFAHSEDGILGGGNAERLELRHVSEKLFARIFWGRADDHFKNQTAILTAGRTEAGAQISYQLGKNTRAIVQAVDTEARDAGSRRGVLAGIEQTFGRDIRLEIGGRYSTETRTAASASTALTPGATPNEVRSARIQRARG